MLACSIRRNTIPGPPVHSLGTIPLCPPSWPGRGTFCLGDTPRPPAGGILHLFSAVLRLSTQLDASNPGQSHRPMAKQGWNTLYSKLRSSTRPRCGKVERADHEIPSLNSPLWKSGEDRWTAVVFNRWPQARRKSVHHGIPSLNSPLRFTAFIRSHDLGKVEWHALNAAATPATIGRGNGGRVDSTTNRTRLFPSDAMTRLV